MENTGKPSSGGAVIAIGGSEDKEGQMNVLKRVLGEAAGKRVLVVTTATSYPENARERYEKAFGRLNVDSLTVAHIETRAQACDPATARLVEDADLIFFSGGDQMKLTHILGGTPFFQTLKRKHQEGATVAGTSAGAAALSGLMIYGGMPADGFKKGAIKASPGFGFIRDAVVDTHFSQRGRLPRLFQMVAANPGLVAVGIDEDTAIVAKAGESRFEVVGSGTVTVVDGRACRSDIAARKMGQAFSVSGLAVHTLVAGQTYDPVARQVGRPPSPS